VRIVVIGAGPAGIAAALLLARSGHEVDLLDRDDTAPAPDVESAAADAFRPGAPQVVQPHGMLPLARHLLADLLPDVHAGLLSAGAVEVPLAWQLPPRLVGEAPREGDERIVMLAARRTTLDWVFRRTVAVEPRVTVRASVRVAALLAECGDPPTVTGVRTTAGDIVADLVVDASGRRSAVDTWLTGIGAARTEVQSGECGLSYHSRHYRLTRADGLPGRPTTRVVLGLPEFTAGLWGTDNGSVIMAVAPLVEDRRFARLVEPEVHEAVLRTIPALAPWLDVLEPVSRVYPMGGLHNTYRRFVVQGRPVALGLLAVGDTVCTTNPTMGRGIALAIREAAELTDALRAGAAPVDAALDYDARLARWVEPYFGDQAANDLARLAELRHRISNAPAPEPVRAPDRIGLDELRPAAAFDGVLFRALWRLMGMLDPLEEIYRDPDVIARTRAVHAGGAIPGLAGPTRSELLAALGHAKDGAPAGPVYAEPARTL
jgi:2-polyprenyl-6-methoxyphenol hydroxylase-like FAD-dependent oxidoreductase